MQAQEPAQRRRTDARPLQQCRGGNCSGGRNDSPASDDQGEGRHLCLADGGTHADGMAIFDQHAIDSAVDHDPSLIAVGIEQVGL